MKTPNEVVARETAIEVWRCIVCADKPYGEKNIIERWNAAEAIVVQHTEAALEPYKAALVQAERAAQEVVNRWDSPAWKWDDQHTGDKINLLRQALATIAKLKGERV